MKALRRAYMGLVLFFLYAPLAVMVVFSFNSKNSTAKFGTFSLRWYAKFLSDTTAVRALSNTLLLAFAAALIATVFGTFAAIGIDRLRGKWSRQGMQTLTNLPMMNPEIVTGISLMLLYVSAAQLLGGARPLGFATMLLSHIAFCLPYVILSVTPKLRQCDPHLAEAAQDLGCSPAGAVMKAVLPSIMTGVASGFLMAFTLSIDDFVVSYFVSGPAFQTLPLHIYSMTKKRIAPDMYALSTILFLSIFVLLIVSNVVQNRTEKKAQAERKKTK